MENTAGMITIRHRDSKNGIKKQTRTPSPVQRGLWSYAHEQGTCAALMEGVIIG